MRHRGGNGHSIGGADRTTGGDRPQLAADGATSSLVISESTRCRNTGYGECAVKGRIRNSGDRDGIIHGIFVSYSSQSIAGGDRSHASDTYRAIASGHKDIAGRG